MAKTNTPVRTAPVKTYEGGAAVKPSALAELQRTLFNALLFEDTFYESGESIAKRLTALVDRVTPDQLTKAVTYAKSVLHLRHAPLWMAVQATKRFTGTGTKWTVGLLDSVITRADELGEAFAMYYHAAGVMFNKINSTNKRIQPSHNFRTAVSAAFAKFDEYQFSKYEGEGKLFSLRDAMFMTNPKPSNEERAVLYKQIADGTLKPALTWENLLSAAGKDPEKRLAAWTDLILNNRIGSLALLRNLRNMDKDNVPADVVREAIANSKFRKILPHQFVAAYRFAPAFSREIDDAMLRSMQDFERIPGETLVVIDVSGSMDSALSKKSDLNRIDAASAAAITFNEQCDHARIFTFSNYVKEVTNVRGLGLIEAVRLSQDHGGTYLASALSQLESNGITNKVDRIVVFTDEQSHDGLAQLSSFTKPKYLVNVASYEYALSTAGGWTRIDGFSNNIAEFVRLYEQEERLSN